MSAPTPEPPRKGIYCPVCGNFTLAAHCDSPTCPNWYFCKNEPCGAELSLDKKAGTAYDGTRDPHGNRRRVRVAF